MAAQIESWLNEGDATTMSYYISLVLLSFVIKFLSHRRHGLLDLGRYYISSFDTTLSFRGHHWWFIEIFIIVVSTTHCCTFFWFLRAVVVIQMIMFPIALFRDNVFTTHAIYFKAIILTQSFLKAQTSCTKHNGVLKSSAQPNFNAQFRKWP